MKAGQIFVLFAVISGSTFGMKRKAPEDDAPLRNVRPKYWAAPVQSKFLDTLVAGLEQGIFDGSAVSTEPLITLVSSVLDEGIYAKEQFEKLLPVIHFTIKTKMSREMHFDLLKGIARYLYGAPETVSSEDFQDFLAFVDPLLKGEPWTKPILPARRKHGNLIGELIQRAPDHIRRSKYSLPAMKYLCHFINLVRECLAIQSDPDQLADIQNALRYYIVHRPCMKEKIFALLDEQDSQFVESRIAEAFKEEFGHLGNVDLIKAMRSGISQDVRDILRHGSADVSSNNQEAMDIFFFESFLPADILELMLENSKVDPRKGNNGYFKVCAKRSDMDCCKVLLKDKRFDPTLDNGSILISAAENGQIPILRLLLEDGRLGPFLGAAKKAANSAKKTDALLFLTFYGQEQTLNETIKKSCAAASEISIKALLNIPGANHDIAFNALAAAKRIDLLKTFISMPSFKISFDCIVPDEFIPYMDLIYSVRKHDADGLSTWLCDWSGDLEWLEWALIAAIRHMDNKMLSLVIQKMAYIDNDFTGYKYLSEIRQLIGVHAPSYGQAPTITIEQMKNIVQIIRHKYNL